jgi:hypothetical protein
VVQRAFDGAVRQKFLKKLIEGNVRILNNN